MTRTLFTALAIAAIATTAALPAFAAEPARTMTIKVSDIDLNTDAGQRTAQQRILQAAQTICSTSATGSRLRVIDPDCRDAYVAELNSQLKRNQAKASRTLENAGLTSSPKAVDQAATR